MNCSPGSSGSPLDAVDPNNTSSTSLADILLKAQSRIEEARQERLLHQPLPLPQVQYDDDEDEEKPQKEIHEARASRIITAPEAYRIMTGISEFKSLLDVCKQYIITSIDECRNVVRYHIPNVMSVEDLNQFAITLRQCCYTVINNFNGELEIRWYNQYTQSLNEQQLVQALDLFRSRDSLSFSSEVKQMFNAYEACLREIERDRAYVETKEQEMENLIQVDIDRCLEPPNQTGFFVFEVPIGQLLGRAQNREYHLKLLEKAFTQFIQIVRHEWKYNITEIVRSLTLMKFKLIIPGFIQTASKNVSTESSLRSSSSGQQQTQSQQTRPTFSAFSNDYSDSTNYNSVQSHQSTAAASLVNLFSGSSFDMTVELKRIRQQALERHVKSLFSDLVLTIQKFIYYKNLLRRDRENIQLQNDVQQLNAKIESVQETILQLILNPQ